MPRSPFTDTLIQSTVLNAISNLLAQVIDQYRENKPFTLNTIALLQFVSYAIITVPINFYWQNYVEAQFPGFPTWRSWRSSASNAPPVIDPEALATKEKPTAEVMKKPRSGRYNFFMKLFLDQTVCSVMNILLFIVLINLFKGCGWRRIYELICEDFGPIMIARLKYRPVVSTLMYTVIPVERRVVFLSACGVIWGVYLSLYAAV